MRPVVSAYIALGANLGDAPATLVQAMQHIATTPGIVLLSRSGLYRTAPLQSSGPDYVNAVIAIETSLSAPALLAQLQQHEQAAGRLRPYHNAPRTLDLDLLLYGQARIFSAALTVPHPRMTERAFVLVPLAEIAPNQVSPAQLQAVCSQNIQRL